MSNLEYILGPETWGVRETSFNPNWLGKYESIMSQGNGYMGLRASTEESYSGEVKGNYVAGTFNAFYGEVTELPNLPDVVSLDIYVDDILLNLNLGKYTNYQRELNVKTGELTRSFIWQPKDDLKLYLEFKRIVSMKRRHVIAQQVILHNQSEREVSLVIYSGVDGRVTNSGTQHLVEGEKRLIEDEFIQMTSTTCESSIEIVNTTTHSFILNDKEFTPDSLIGIERRKIHNRYRLSLAAGDKLSIDKVSSVHTSRDNDLPEDISLTEFALNSLRGCKDIGYEKLAVESSKAWDEKVWSVAPITIKSENPIDQLAIYFAQYHMHVMTPGHDNRMNIGAKGLSGEGYKGHTFWDTEIYLLPYFNFTHPDIARSLLEHRYNTLPSAYKKAKENGYEGAMYPWESAWLDDGEVTPLWGPADVVTGEPFPILTGKYEIHVTADVALGVQQYYQITKDEDFMIRYGRKIILETARFWNDRFEYNDKLDRYEINMVIGPDEYTEKIDNNSYTNYLAALNVKLAIDIIDDLLEGAISIEDYDLSKEELIALKDNFENKVEKVYLPTPNEEGIIPQDDTFLDKPIIDISHYKEHEEVGLIFEDYNMDQIGEMQVIKQSDIVLLLFLLEDKFEPWVKKANFDYYEPKTTHDSSLSLSTHSILASDLGLDDLAYDLFTDSYNIDMGQAMKSSDEGIHAASQGGVWQVVVFGFGGLRLLEDGVRIEPNLPKNWNELSYGFFWRGQEIKVHVTKDNFEVINKGQETFEFYYQGEQVFVEAESKLVI